MKRSLPGGGGVSPAGGLQPDKWELYNVKEDRTELNNLAASNAEKVKVMSRQWQAWSERVGVFPKKKAIRKQTLQ